MFDFYHRQFSVAKIVDFEFFINARIDTFRKFEAIGWGPYFTLNKPVFPKMVKEFFLNLVFDDDELQAMSMIKGQKMELTIEFMDDVIGCPNEGGSVTTAIGKCPMKVTTWRGPSEN